MIAPMYIKQLEDIRARLQSMWYVSSSNYRTMGDVADELQNAKAHVETAIRYAKSEE